MRLTPPSLPHSTGAGHCQGRPGVHFSLDSALLLCYLLQSDISLGRAERKLANIYLTHTDDVTGEDGDFLLPGAVV